MYDLKIVEKLFSGSLGYGVDNAGGGIGIGIIFGVYLNAVARNPHINREFYS